MIFIIVLSSGCCFCVEGGNKLQQAVGTSRVNTDQITESHAHTYAYTPGFTPKVQEMLQQAVDIGHVSKGDLDERALSDLKALPERGAIAVLSEFMKKDTTRIRNKSAFLNGIICRVQVRPLVSYIPYMYTCILKEYVGGYAYAVCGTDLLPNFCIVMYKGAFCV